MNQFSKTRRLLIKADYDNVFSCNKKLVTPEFILLYSPNSLGFSRLGLAISKKKIAKAYQRNQVKRLPRESFRVHKLPAVDIVVLARINPTKSDNDLILKNLDHAWLKLTHCCVG